MREGGAGRWVVLFVAGSLVVSACGGGSDADPSVVSRSAGTASSEVPGSSDAPGENGNAEVDARAADLLAMPADQQEQYLSELALRFERELATVSGLEESLGGAEAADVALREAWAPTIEQARALKVESLVAGVRRTAPSAPNIGEGLFGGMIVVSLGSDGAVTASNDATAGAPPERRTGSDTTLEATLERATLDIDTTHTSSKGVTTKFKVKVMVLPCPDAAGRFQATAKIDISATAGSVGQTGTMDITLDGQVDDNAALVSSDVGYRMQWADFAGGKGQFVDVSGGYSNNSSTDVTVNRTGGKVTADLVKSAISVGSLFGLLLAGKLADAAQKGWESGRCVQLDPTASPGPKAMDPSSTSTITAAPRSKVDGGPVGGSVVASLTGGTSVDPSGVKVPADATFAYVAPDENGKTATVALEARSKRGVAKAAVDFDTAALPTVHIAGPVQFSLAGLTGTAVVDLTLSPDSEGAYTGTADLQITGALEVMLTSCTPATWTEAIDLMATLTTENEESALVISTIGEPPRGEPVATTCTTAGVAIPATTSLISSSLFGEVHIRLVDGDQTFVDAISLGTVSGSVTVTLS